MRFATFFASGGIVRFLENRLKRQNRSLR